MDWITVSEAKQLTGMSGGSIHWAIAKQRFPARKSGNFWEVDKAGLIKHFGLKK